MSIFNKEEWDSKSSGLKADMLRDYLIQTDSKEAEPEADEDDENCTHRFTADIEVNVKVEEIDAENENMAEGGTIDPQNIKISEWEIARKPFYWMSGLTTLFAFLASLLFNYGILTAFPFMVGAATVFFGLTLVVVIDALLIPGNTYKTISGSSTGLSIVLLAVSILIGIGLSIGQSYVSNPFSAEERVEVQAPAEAADGTGTEDPATDTIPPPADAELALPSSEGRAFREQ